MTIISNIFSQYGIQTLQEITALSPGLQLLSYLPILLAPTYSNTGTVLVHSLFPSKEHIDWLNPKTTILFAGSNCFAFDAISAGNIGIPLIRADPQIYNALCKTNNQYRTNNQYPLGILRHELGHIKNNDSLNRVFLQVSAVGIIYLAFPHLFPSISGWTKAFFIRASAQLAIASIDSSLRAYTESRADQFMLDTASEIELEGAACFFAASAGVESALSEVLPDGYNSEGEPHIPNEYGYMLDRLQKVFSRCSELNQNLNVDETTLENLTNTITPKIVKQYDLRIESPKLESLKQTAFLVAKALLEKKTIKKRDYTISRPQRLVHSIEKAIVLILRFISLDMLLNGLSGPICSDVRAKPLQAIGCSTLLFTAATAAHMAWLERSNLSDQLSFLTQCTERELPRD